MGDVMWESSVIDCVCVCVGVLSVNWISSCFRLLVGARMVLAYIS